MKFFEEQLKNFKNQNLFRSIKDISKIEGKYIYINNKKYLDFSSNNYLGLRDDIRIKEAVKEAIDIYGIGSGASRLITGTFDIFKNFENQIAKYKNKESAIIFNSGYDANLGLISSIFDKNDIIFSDKLNHASIYDGIFLSKAKLSRFKHNDIKDLELKLSKYRNEYKKALVVVDTVFSMDGDRIKLKEIVKLKKKYDFILMIDEAHGTGLFGENGAGVAEEENLLDEVDINMGTLGKSFGCQGAYIAANNDIINYIINKSRSLIYTTSLSPLMISGAIKALEIIKTEPQRRKKVLDLANYLRERLNENGFETLESNTQIVPVILKTNEKALEMSKKLYDNNIIAPAIRQPTVPINTARLRLSVNYNLDEEDIDKLVNILIS